MLLPRFDPPALLDDLTDAQKTAWSNFVSGRFDAETASALATGHHFYNPTKKDTSADVATVEISWTAFPRNVAVTAPTDRARWQQADGARDVQDEYCEWSVTRDPTTQKITRVTFTCEGPEYWRFFAQTNPAKVLSLYQQFVSPAAKRSDLFTASGQYRPRNKWNNSTARGAMHLVQDANTLGAEINIAVRSTVIRRINGVVLTGERELIDCGQYGDPDRNSDPHIGEKLNELARQQADITIANPVGLYISDLTTLGWKTPDNSDPKTFWKIVRGDAAHAVRAVFEVPATKGFTVGDITINGNPIEFGAQIADFITIKIVGQACRLGQITTPPVTQCVGDPPVDPAAANVEAALAPHPGGHHR